MHAHLLFVEQTDGSLSVLRSALERTGVTASVVHGSDDLGRLLRSVCPDLVVVEGETVTVAGAPQPDAIDVCRRTYPWLPVVVQVLDGAAANGLAEMRLRADLVLDEPAPDDETTARIRRLLGGRRVARGG